jgi:hypothetical protein
MSVAMKTYLATYRWMIALSAVAGGVFGAAIALA